MKKVPLRKCVATFEQLPKKELVRVVKTPDGQVVIDTTGRQNGRGAYLKKSREAFDIARQRNALGRSLETPIPESVYEDLEKLLNE